MTSHQQKLIRATTLLVFGILFFVISCKKTEKLGQSQLTVPQLKSWYDQQSKFQSQNSNLFSQYKPDWETAQTTVIDGYNVTEINFTNPNKLVITNGDRTDAEKDKILNNTNVKLVLFNLVNSNTVTGAYMMLKSDSQQKVNEVHYKDFGSFTGMLSYYNFSGKFENGYILKTGKVTKSLVKSALSPNQLLQLKGSKSSAGLNANEKLMLYNINDDCDVETYDFYYESCVSVPAMPELGTTCSWVYSYSLTVINCVPGSAGPGGGPVDGGYTGIGGGGGDPGNTPGGTSPAQFNSNISLAGLTPCASSVMHSLMYQSTGSVVMMIQKFSGEIPGYSWEIKNGSLSQNENASTKKISAGASTTIDLSKYTNGTDMALARTLLHESVHAYLVSYFSSNPLLANLSYPEMIEEWNKIKDPNLNDIHHNEMVIEFKNDIARGLREYGDMHNYTFPSPIDKDEFYSDMAWGGLEQTKAYKNLSTTDKNRIQDTILAEQYGTDRNGSPKSGKGSPSGC
nr:hypothetical protein [Pedobacter sp. ASV2]